MAAAMKLSPALVYKWCEPPGDEAGGAAGAPAGDSSGAKNPLDRVRDLYLLTKDIRLVRWLCNEAGGFYVANPVPPEKGADRDKTAIMETRNIVREFSELLDEITHSMEDDTKIDPQEAIRIRERWEDLKSQVEGFVLRAERGHYR